ncbi:MAG: hypothetical protein ABSH01_04710 [Terriglobia bacterium]
MKTKVFWWFLLVSCALCVLEGLPIAIRGDPGGAFGYMVGFAFFPFLVAYIARGRKGDWDSFSKWFFFGILICGSLTARQQAKDWRNWSADRLKRHMGEIIQNAESGHPNAAVADSTPFDDVMRGYYADVAGEAKTYEATTAAVDVADIYTAKSFSSKETVQQVITRVQTLAAANRDFYNFWMSEPQAVEKRLSQSSASYSDQKDFMVGFHKTYDISPMGKLLKARCDWSASVISLYSFALLHSSEIHVSRQQLVIDPKTFDEFKQKEDASFALQKTVLALRAQVDKSIQNTKNAFGLKNR